MSSDEIDPIDETIYRLNVCRELDIDYLELAFKKLLTMENGPAKDVKLGSLLTGLMVKKPTTDELFAILEAAFSYDTISPFNSKKESVDLPYGKKLLTAVGSGKKGVKTINISTASMLVASSLGVYAAKPGSSSVSSLTGSADLVRELGVNIDIDLADAKRVIRDVGFIVLPIERYLPFFGSLYNNKLYTPHALSFALAALTNPLKTDKLLYGLSHPDVETSVHVFKRFDFDNVMVISCTHDDIHYIDEFGIYGKTKVMGIRNGTIGRPKYFQPTEILKLPNYSYEDIKQGRTKEENVQLVVDVLMGSSKRSALEDIVAINTSALLYLDGVAKDIKDGYEMAKDCIRHGKPMQKLRDVIDATNGNHAKLEKYT